MKDKKTVYHHTEQSVLGNIDETVDKIRARVATIGWLMLAMFVILLIAICSGCCKTTATVDTEKHLMTITRTRFLITEDIGSVSFDATDGSFTIDGYKSDMTRALELVKYFAALSERKDEVKP